MMGQTIKACTAFGDGRRKRWVHLASTKLPEKSSKQNFFAYRKKKSYFVFKEESKCPSSWAFLGCPVSSSL